MPSSDRIARLKKRYEALSSDRTQFDADWQELARYIRPRRQSVLLELQPGASITDYLYDATALNANARLASSMQGALTNPVTQWFSLRATEEGLDGEHEVRVWLDLVATRINRALQASNFVAENNEVYQDLGAFGTAALFETEGPILERGQAWGGLLFRSFSAGEYVVAESPSGIVDTLFRQVKMPRHAIVTQWGAAARVSHRIQDHEFTKPDEFLDVIHAIYPRGQDPDAPSFPQPWVSIYWLEADQTILSDKGFWEFPVMVPRWAKASNEVYGRGPGHYALPDIKTLNKAVELNLKAWDKEIDPPLFVEHQGVIGKIRLHPGGITYTRRSPKEAIMPLQTGARHDVTAIEVERLKEAIRETFFNNQLQLPDKTIITATEVERRLELMQRILGPTIGRLSYELLEPLLRRSFMLLLRANRLPPMPPALQVAAMAGRAELGIVFEGPIARAMRQTDVQALQRAMALVAPLLQIKPELADNFDFDRAVRETVVDLGVTPRFLRAEREVAVVRTQRAQLQAAAVQAQTQVRTVEAQQAQAGAQRDRAEAAQIELETVEAARA